MRKNCSDNLSIFLEGNPSQTLAFREMRGKEDEQDNFRNSVVEKEYHVVCQLKKYSDLIIAYEN